MQDTTDTSKGGWTAEDVLEMIDQAKDFSEKKHRDAPVTHALAAEPILRVFSLADRKGLYEGVGAYERGKGKHTLYTILSNLLTRATAFLPALKKRELAARFSESGRADALYRRLARLSPPFSRTDIDNIIEIIAEITQAYHEQQMKQRMFSHIPMLKNLLQAIRAHSKENRKDAASKQARDLLNELVRDLGRSARYKRG